MSVFPFLTLEPVLDRLSAQFWFSRVRKNRKGCLDGRVRRLLHTVGEVIYPAEPISLKALGHLKKGSLVKLQDFDESPALLRMGGETVLKLRRKRKRRLYFVPVNRAGVEPFLRDRSEEKDGEERIVALMEGLERQLDGFRSELAGKISQLEERQDSWEDRSLLNQDSAARPEADGAPFGFFSAADLTALQQALSGEQSQIVAFVLSPAGTCSQRRSS